MAALLNNVDPDGLLEYSVVYTDRALNHMSKKFQIVMNDLSKQLREIYQADAVAIIPGSGTTGMEAVARQFAKGKKCLTLRNGFFNFRWTQIFEMGNIPTEEIVLKAQAIKSEENTHYVPYPIEKAVSKILDNKPDLVFATHIETSAGIILPDNYIKRIAQATHEVGGIFVLDCIASGAIWINMKELGVDIITTAPQKGWSSTPCAGIVLLNEKAVEKIESTQSDSFSIDLKKWLEVMRAYENGGHTYHATMPTDSLTVLRDTIFEAQKLGFDYLKKQQIILGTQIRQLLTDKGIKSIAAPDYAAPSIVVAYTDQADIKSGKKFVEVGVQIASGVPLKCDEPADFSTFRIGLLGLDKLTKIDRTVQLFDDALTKVLKG